MFVCVFCRWVRALGHVRGRRAPPLTSISSLSADLTVGRGYQFTKSTIGRLQQNSFVSCFVFVLSVVLLRDENGLIKSALRTSDTLMKPIQSNADKSDVMGNCVGSLFLIAERCILINTVNLGIRVFHGYVCI